MRHSRARRDRKEGRRGREGSCSCVTKATQPCFVVEAEKERNMNKKRETSHTSEVKHTFINGWLSESIEVRGESNMLTRRNRFTELVNKKVHSSEDRMELRYMLRAMDEMIDNDEFIEHGDFGFR